LKYEGFILFPCNQADLINGTKAAGAVVFAFVDGLLSLHDESTKKHRQYENDVVFHVSK